MASFLGTKRIWREVFTVEKAVLKTNPIRSYKTGSLLLLQTVLANLDGGGELIEKAIGGEDDKGARRARLLRGAAAAIELA